MDNKNNKTVSGSEAVKSDKKSLETPWSIYKLESDKTDSVNKKYSDIYKKAKDEVTDKRQEIAHKVEQLAEKLDKDIAENCKFTLGQVKSLSASAKEQYSYIKDLERKLATAKKEYVSTNKNLRKSKKKLDKEGSHFKKVYSMNRSNVEKTGKIELAAAAQKEKECGKQLKKSVKSERRATVINTIKGTFSYVFNIPAAFAGLVADMASSLSFSFNRKSLPKFDEAANDKKQLEEVTNTSIENVENKTVNDNVQNKKEPVAKQGRPKT